MALIHEWNFPIWVSPTWLIEIFFYRIWLNKSSIHRENNFFCQCETGFNTPSTALFIQLRPVAFYRCIIQHIISWHDNSNTAKMIISIIKKGFVYGSFIPDINKFTTDGNYGAFLSMTPSAENSFAAHISIRVACHFWWRAIWCWSPQRESGLNLFLKVSIYLTESIIDFLNTVLKSMTPFSLLSHR